MAASTVTATMNRLRVMPRPPAKCSRAGDVDARRRYEWIRVSTLRRPDLNAVDLRIVCPADREVDGNRAGAVCSCVERLLRCCIFSPSRSKDVVIVEHLFVVDGDVEETLTRCGPVGLREVQIDDIRATWDETRDRIGRRSVSVGLIYRLRRRVGNEGCVDGRTGRSRRAAREVLIG
jgi:hypothetical protein